MTTSGMIIKETKVGEGNKIFTIITAEHGNQSGAQMTNQAHGNRQDHIAGQRFHQTDQPLAAVVQKQRRITAISAIRAVSPM